MISLVRILGTMLIQGAKFAQLGALFYVVLHRRGKK